MCLVIQFGVCFFACMCLFCLSWLFDCASVFELQVTYIYYKPTWKNLRCLFHNNIVDSEPRSVSVYISGKTNRFSIRIVHWHECQLGRKVGEQTTAKTFTKVVIFWQWVNYPPPWQYYNTLYLNHTRVKIVSACRVCDTPSAVSIFNIQQQSAIIFMIHLPSFHSVYVLMEPFPISSL